MKINQPNTELYDRIGLHELALQIVKADGWHEAATEHYFIQYLLPIGAAYGYYTNWKLLSFFDRRKNKTYREKFEPSDEESRTTAISKINERISDYTRFVDEHVEELGKENISNQKYFHLSENILWGLYVKLHNPTFDHEGVYGEMTDSNLIRTIDNEFVYKQGLELPVEEFVLRFNKMMYDYINKLIPKNMPFNKHNLFYKPITEFNNWFMSRGLFVDEVPSLIDDLHTDSVKAKKSVHQETEDSISEKQLLTNELRASHNKVQIQKREIKILKSGFTNNELERAAYLTMKNIGTLNFAKLGRLIGKSDNGARNILKERLPHLYLQHQQKDIYQPDDIDIICPACGNTFDEPPCTCVRK